MEGSTKGGVCVIEGIFYLGRSQQFDCVERGVMFT